MRVGNRVLQACAAIGVTIGVLASIAPPSYAQPAAAAGQAADAPTLSMSTLGVDVLDDTIALSGLQGVQTITVPVPKGLTPSALTADVDLPPYVRGGTLMVTQGDRTLSRVELLAADSTPINIPLTGARVVDNTVTFTVRSRLVPEEGDCLYDPTLPLQLTSAAIAYTGKETVPGDVASFLPPVLQRLTVFVPAKPTLAESDAAVRLTTAVVARYGTQNADVEVKPLADGQQPPPSAALERNIVVREGDDAGAALRGDRSGVPTLWLTGRGDDLAKQAELVDSDLAQFALSSDVVAGTVNTAAPASGTEKTLHDMGQTDLTATGFEPRVDLHVDQTQLGGPVRDVRVHLKGSYTPLPSTVGGQIVVSNGRDTIDRWAADSSGTIDRGVTIPDSALRRDTDLSVSVDIAGDVGQCGEFQPVTLRADDATTISGSRVDPTEAVGFQSIPQALLPNTQVGIAPDSFDDTARAVAIMAGLQRLSGPRIGSHVASLSDAVNGDGPAVLIDANGWDDTKVVPPLHTSGDGKLDIQRVGGGGEASLTLNPAAKFASLQVGRSGDRTLLFATSQSGPKDLDGLLTWLHADPRRWSALQGTAVITRPGADPVQVNTQAATQPAAASHTSPLWWIAVAAAALIGVGLIVLLTRRGRAPNA
jgi:hypothetical protein